MKAINQPLFTDPSHLVSLKNESKVGSADNLREVAQQFESLFTHMLLKNMRSASLASGVFDSDQSKFYQDMFDQQMSTELSSGRGLGIAELLVKQMGGSAGENSTAKPALSFVAQDAGPQRLESFVKASKIEGQDTVTGPLEFVNMALPHARRIGKALGVAPRIILAQAALETGWGQKPIRNDDGTDSHNVFGIKATSKWSGSSAVVNTLEFVAGLGQRVNAAFRSYDSIGDSFDDYAKLIKSSRYRDALNTGEDSKAFATALKRGGYATDPEYAAKISKIADGGTLNNAIEISKVRHE